MSRYVLLRLLDGFFRRWWLLLVPVVLLGAVGAMSALGTEREYKSAGAINVSASTVLSDLTSSNVNFGYRTPADATAGDINQLLGTGGFVKTLAESAGLTSSLETGALTIPEIRSAIGVSSSGDNVVSVAATYANAEVAYRLATATIDSYVRYQINTAIGGSQVAIDVFNGVVADYQSRVDEAQSAFDQYLQDHPQQLDGTYTAADTVQLTQLQSALDSARARLDDAQSKLDDATLTKAQAETQVTQQLQVIDEPELPTSHEPQLKRMALSLVMFLAIGCLLSLAALVGSVAADRSIRFPLDVEQRLDAPALASIPRVKPR